MPRDIFQNVIEGSINNSSELTKVLKFLYKIQRLTFSQAPMFDHIKTCFISMIWTIILLLHFTSLKYI